MVKVCRPLFCIFSVTFDPSGTEKFVGEKEKFCEIMLNVCVCLACGVAGGEDQALAVGRWDRGADPGVRRDAPTGDLAALDEPAEQRLLRRSGGDKHVASTGLDGVHHTARQPDRSLNARTAGVPPPHNVVERTGDKPILRRVVGS